MTKRVVTKIGDIFCISIDNSYKCHFQYIANDKTQLNSSVIRMFKKHYEIDSHPSINEIIKDDISFYAHTILKVGLLNGTWKKVGSHKEIGNIEDIRFRLYGKKWYGWRINQKIVEYDTFPDDFEQWDSGWVFSYLSILERICLGKWTKW